MRVLYVDNSLGFGGAIKSLSLTLRGLADVEKLVLTSQDPDIIDLWLAGHEVRRFRTRLNYRTTLRIRRSVERYSRPAEFAVAKALAVADVVLTAVSARRMAHLMRQRKIDVVHLNNGILPLEALRAARRAGVPVVVHLRDFQHDKRRAASAEAASIARVIAVSGAVASSLDGSAVAPDRIVVVHDPVDVDALDAAASARKRIRAQWSIADDHIAVAIFGRVIPWKGQREFVQAAIAAARENPAIRILIVGDESDGEREYMASVRQLIADSGLETRFILAGYQGGVEEYYAAADVVVHASITPEPFGMVVPEAMAAGKPVIAADAGGPREVVTQGVEGLLVPPGDVPALARAIVELAGDPERRSRMGRAGRDKVVRELGLAANARHVRAVYEQLLRDRARTSR